MTTESASSGESRNPSESKSSMHSLELIYSFLQAKDDYEQQKQIKNQPVKSTNAKCLQIEFHSIYKNFLILLYSKAVCIYDLVICQVISNIQIEKTSNPFIQVITNDFL